MPRETVENTLVAEYNNIESVRRIFMEHGKNIAGVIIEPVAGTMSGNPIATAAGLTTLKKLYKNPDYYKHIEKLGKRLEDGIKEASMEIGRVNYL